MDGDTYISAGMQYGILISFLAVIMAFLVAQTRVESGIHTLSEVFFGGVLGIIVTTILFQLWG